MAFRLELLLLTNTAHIIMIRAATLSVLAIDNDSLSAVIWHTGTIEI